MLDFLEFYKVVITWFDNPNFRFRSLNKILISTEITKETT